MADTAKHEREIVLDDAELLTMIQMKGEMVEQGRSMSRRQTDLQSEIDKITQEMGALTSKVINHKLKIFRRIKKLAKNLLNEYEIPVTTDIKDGKPVLLVADALEEFRDTFQGFDKFSEPVPRKKKLEDKS